jgi:hypothetical protein
MTVLDHAQRLRHGPRSVVLLLALLFVSAATFATALIAYLLTPTWTQAPLDAPPLPVTVAGVVFNVPPAAIRMPVQRRAGAQERVDLAYRWPDLLPPDASTADAAPRLFATIESTQPQLSPIERLKSVYPRYFGGPSTSLPGGLILTPFADGTPYQGEDVIYDSTAPDRFLVRCSRSHGDMTLAVCLYERTIGDAAVTFRFPRGWLSDWQTVQGGIDRLIERWRPSAVSR